MSDKEKSYKEIESDIERLKIEKSLLLEKQLSSKEPEDILKAQEFLKGKDKDKSKDIKAYLYSPEREFYNGLGYKSSLKSITYDLLRGMGETPVVFSVIKTRIDQVQKFMSFTTDEEKEGWTIKRKLNRFEAAKGEYELTDEDKREIDKIATYLEQGGFQNKWEQNDDFDVFNRKLVKDSLELDQACFEVERTRGFDVLGHTMVDGGTIRLLESIDPFSKENPYDTIKEYPPIYAQVYNNQILKNKITGEPIVYYPWEMAFITRNKSTNIRRNGYGKSELEILIEIITYLLWGIQYNGNFFKQGSNPKGFFTIEGDVNETMMHEFRSAWRQTMAGVSNCISGETFVYTDKGGLSIEDLYSIKEDFKIWDGEEFNDAKVYKTGFKKLNKMYLNNGIVIESSPDHRFKIIDTDGNFIWKRRYEIKEGDYVLVNKKIKSIDSNLSYNGIKLEEDFFEILGWSIGNGSYGKDLPKKRRMQLFYNSIKERDICERHLSILKKYGINAYIDEYFYKDKEAIKKRYGFKSVADSNLKIQIIDCDFFKYLLTLGFKPSWEGKEIPKFMYTIDSKLKNSFIKGFFSADGNNSTGRAIQMTIVDNKLREQTKLLLLSEGIRCGNHEGKGKKHTFGKMPAGYILLIKDLDAYFDKIGFIQDWKQKKTNCNKISYVKESLPPFLGQLIAKDIKSIVKKRSKENKINIGQKIISKLSGIITGKDNITKEGIENFAKEIGYDLPDYFEKYNFEKVLRVEDTGIEIPMYDIEVMDEKHQFIANGIVTHNSHKVPIFEGSKIQWQDMQHKNSDMEFSNWNEFLMLLTCSVYTIDPSELGYNFKNQSQMFGQQGQKERLEHSIDKGLKPILMTLKKNYNKFLVSELSNNKYEFCWTGIDLEDETQQLENDIKKSGAGFVSQGDMFEKYSKRKFNDKKDIILNQVYQQAQQAKQFGGEESNQAVDEMAGGEDQGVSNPFDEYEKGMSNDPITKASMDYINRLFQK